MPSGAPIVEARGVAFAYGARGAGGAHEPRRSVLRGVDLTIRPGELVALVGTNGSGKTTLLRLVAGTLAPSAGSLRLFGRPAAAWSRMEAARQIALLPQSLELPDGFRVGELVAMGRLPHARSRFGATADDAEAVERALVDADLLPLAGRDVAELSGGERQRVGVAMALAQQPALLLLDEPTLHLDVAHQVTLLEMIDGLRARRDLTVVAVIHDLAMAAVVPRVSVLDAGRIAADGPPEEALTPDLVRRVFGIGVEEWQAADGGRRLAVALPRLLRRT